MERNIKQRKVLVLRGTAGKDKDLLEAVSSCFAITSAQSVDEALALLAHEDFDAVFSITADFLPLERASVSQQAVAILNTIGEGVCIVSGDGTLLWTNQKAEKFSDSIKQGICQRSRQAFEYFSQRITTDKNQPLSRKYSLTDEKDRYFEMNIAPMFDEKGELVRVATVVWEETASRQLQQRINVIDKAGRELVRLDAESFSKLSVEERINLLQDKIIRYARELLHFDHFVVRIMNRQNNQLEVLFGVGLEGDVETQVFANVENNGITGYVAATGRSYICNDPASDPRYLPGLDGVQSSLTIPLRLHDQVIGTLNVESSKKAAFGEDDRQMAEIFGRYIAISLNILNLLVVEHYKTTGQTAEDLNREVSEPLNNIMTDASQLMEDYIGHDDIRHRLQGIMDKVIYIKKALKGVQEGPKGIFGSQITAAATIDPALLSKQVLVVDDEQFIRQTISDVLQKYGCSVDTAGDARQAQSLIAQRTYDLVVSDIKLPFGSGYEIFAAARQKDQGLPVILMTGFGYDPNHSIVRANREGLSAVLYKPFKVEQLMVEVRSALTKTKA